MSKVTFDVGGEKYRVLSGNITAGKEHDVDGRATSSLTAGFTTLEIVMDDKTAILSEKVNPYSTVSNGKLTIFNPADGQSEIEVEFIDFFFESYEEKMSANTERPSSIFLTISAFTTKVAGVEIYRADNPKHYTL